MGKFKPSKKVNFKCLSCGKFEEIPRDVVVYFDEMDGGDPSVHLVLTVKNAAT